MLAKDGQRGGRFGLIEAGAATQNIALRLSRHRLAGYLAPLRDGSSLDRPDSLFDLILVGLSVSW
jgi:hypothetical protein